MTASSVSRSDDSVRLPIGAQQAYETLGIAPLPEAGRAWTGLHIGQRLAALTKLNLNKRYATRGWRSLPRYVQRDLSEAHAARK